MKKVRQAIFLILFLGLFVWIAYFIISIQKARIVSSTDAFVSVKAIENYERVLKDNPNDYSILWKLAHYYSETGLLEDKKNLRKKYLIKAIDYAHRAIEVDNNKYEGHLYLAESLGLLLKYEGPVDRVRHVRKIKKEAERAIGLNPSHYRGYLILGIWHRKVYGASKLEKSLAKIFLGGIPKASLQEAKKYLEKSKELRPNFPKTHYELGLTYMETGDKELAIEEFNKAINSPITNRKEKEVKEEAQRIIKSILKR